MYAHFQQRLHSNADDLRAANIFLSHWRSFFPVSIVPCLRESSSIYVINLFSVPFHFHDFPLSNSMQRKICMSMAPFKPLEFDVWPLRNRKKSFSNQIHFPLNQCLFSLSSKVMEEINYCLELDVCLERWILPLLVLFSQDLAESYFLPLSLCSDIYTRAQCPSLYHSSHSFLIYKYCFVPSIISTCRPPL